MEGGDVPRTRSPVITEALADIESAIRADIEASIAGKTGVVFVYLPDRDVMLSQLHEELDRQALTQALKHTHGSLLKSAKRLGLPLSTFKFKLSQHKISAASFRKK